MKSIDNVGKLSRLVVCLAGVVAMPVVADAGVTLVSADRSISGTSLFPLETQTKTASGFELFDETLQVETTGVVEGDRSVATVSQRSSVSASRLQASGSLALENIGSESGAATNFSVLFDVTESTPFSLTYDLSAVVERNTNSQTERGRVELRRVDGDSIVGPDLLSLAQVIIGEPEGPERVNTFDGTGTLTAGRYEVLLRVDAPFDAFFDGSKFRVEYDLDLRLGGGGDNGGPNPIPLPPAALAGGAVLAGLGATRRFKGLRRR